MTRSTIGTLIGLLLTALLAACASDAPPPAAPSATVASETVESDDRVERTTATEVVATVRQIDQATRRVVLALPDGSEIDIVAGDHVKNLAQVSVGDQVRATYYESYVFQVRKPGEAEQGASEVADVASAAPGAQPGAVALKTVTITTPVAGIDREKGTITLSLVDGSTRTLRVQNPDNLDKVKVGELLEITYSEAFAIQVEKP